MPLRTRGGKLTKLGHFEQEVKGSSLPGGGKPSAAGRRAAEDGWAPSHSGGRSPQNRCHRRPARPG